MRWRSCCAAQDVHGEPARVEVDTRDLRGGLKRWEWIKKGVPMLVEIGPRDIESRKVAVTRRDQVNEKEFVPKEVFIKTLEERLEEVQSSLLKRATDLRDFHTMRVRGQEDFAEFFTPKNKNKPEIHGGFALAHWAGTSEDEEAIQKELQGHDPVYPARGSVHRGRDVLLHREAELAAGGFCEELLGGSPAGSRCHLLLLHLGSRQEQSQMALVFWPCARGRAAAPAARSRIFVRIP